MRIGILADIHGNLDALTAVLEDLEGSGAPDELLVLGDLVAGGPDDCEVVRRLRELPQISCLRGNIDRWVATGEVPLPPGHMRSDEQLRGLAHFSRLCGWSAGALAQAGLLDWIATLPPTLLLALPDGSRLLAVHGSPADDTEGIGQGTPPDRLRAILQSCEAQVLVAGYTHRFFDAEVGGVRVFTVGSVGQPVNSDTSAWYAVPEATESGWALERRSVSFDPSGMIARARKQRHPGAERLARRYGR